MSILNRISEYQAEFVNIRKDIHANPGLQFEVHHTINIVVGKLKEYGVDKIVTGVGITGVVGVIKGKSAGKTIGLRADMDALPILEANNFSHASKISGKMHACGHDGHTTMLLGAAKYLAATRNFEGNVVVIFQPAEEGGGGGKAMIEDGLMTRFEIDEVYGLHTFPNYKLGSFAIRKGPLLASVDTFSISITGKGAHAAKPQASIDPIIIGTSIVNSLQTIVSRSVDPMGALVISVTSFNAGNTTNVIPQTAVLGGTVRSLNPDMRDLAQKRITDIVNNIVSMHGGQVDLDYQRVNPVMSNHDLQVDVATESACAIAGSNNVETDYPASMGGEDFAFMLETRPGAMIFIGQGPGAELHHPEFDFNDEIISIGVSYWVRLAEKRLGELSV